MKRLIEAEQIEACVTRLAQQITHDYGDQPMLMIGVATGCIAFMSDLMRQLTMPLQISLVRARSYRGATTVRGELQIELEELVAEQIAGSHVLLVDDIFDTGHTLSGLVDRIRSHEAADVRSVVLLSKPARHDVDYRPDYVGFEIDDQFVVGYGLDYDGLYRNLPHIAVIESGEASFTFDEQPTTWR